MRALSIVVLLAFLSLLGGCATITTSELQSLSVSTATEKSERVEKAKCTLRNDKGAWEVETPGFVSVQRSAEDLTVECKKDGMPAGFLRAVSRAHGGMFGNIIFGGGIGAIIDHSKGTGYDYPNSLAVRMGTSILVDKRDEQQESGSTSAPRADDKRQ